MKCYVYEADNNFIYYVENASKAHEKNLRSPWWQRQGDKYLKIYPNANEIPAEDKAVIAKNFETLGEKMLSGSGDWKKVLLLFAEKCKQNSIEWYITGSGSEAARGVDIEPHDLDIFVQDKDFLSVKEIFREYLIEPFVDNKGTWLVRYFGKLCVDGFLIDIAADDKVRGKDNRPYEKFFWNGYELFIETLDERLRVEKQRKRKERIRAIRKFMKKNK